MSVTHYLVTGTSAEEVTRLTGLPAHDTHLGTLVEKPPELKVARLQPAFSLGLLPIRRDSLFAVCVT
jgi:hypothetical protein